MCPSAQAARMRVSVRVLLIRKPHLPCETMFAYRSSSACWRKQSLLILARSHKAHPQSTKILRKLKLVSTVQQHGIFPGPDVLHPQNISDPLPYLADTGLNDALFTVPQPQGPRTTCFIIQDSSVMRTRDSFSTWGVLDPSGVTMISGRTSRTPILRMHTLLPKPPTPLPASHHPNLPGLNPPAPSLEWP